MSETMPSLASRVNVILMTWKDLLHINEHVKIVVDVDLTAADGGDIECAMFPAEAVPESAGMYDFVLSLHPDLAAKDDEDLERVIVHELVHLLMEPIRERYFLSRRVAVIHDPTDVRWLSGDEAQKSRPDVLRDWETVIERLADTFIRMFEERR